MNEEITCSGLETKIEDCVRNRAFKSTWMHSEDVGVKCTGKYLMDNARYIIALIKSVLN